MGGASDTHQFVYTVMRLANRSETDMFALPSLMIDVMERVVQARALLRSGALL
jgi:hypothetical protein